VDLELHPADNISEESITFTNERGQRERVRLHDYERVYSVPGLYEDVLLNYLNFASPEFLAELLAKSYPLESLRILDLAAGNGLAGEALFKRGSEYIIGADACAQAAPAAARDYPSVYQEYITVYADDPRLIQAVKEHKLNTLHCVGALGTITVEQFQHLWAAFPVESILSVTCDDLSVLDNPFAAYFKRSAAAGELRIIKCEQFQHRQLMNGDPFIATAVIAEKLR